jgi:AraC-like DNA-binding protein
MARPLQLPVTATLDAAEPWRVNLGSAFQDLVPGALDHEPSPRGSLSGLRLGPVGVFTVSGTPQIVQRTTSAVRRSPGDLIKVCVQLHGRATVRQGRHEVCLDPGELAVYDTGRPYRIRLEGAWTCAVMALPRDAIDLSENDLDRWMHRVYPAAHGPGSVLSHFVVSTVAHPRPLGAAAAAKLGEAGSTLLAGTLLDDGDLAGIDAAGDIRAHVIEYVRAHLDDLRLSRSSIAAAHHMSARTLDRLFADQPWSVSGLIRHERLEAARRDLEDPAKRHRGVAVLAARWGFFDAAHFSRVFRQHYGYPPSQQRPDAGPR